MTPVVSGRMNPTPTGSHRRCAKFKRYRILKETRVPWVAIGENVDTDGILEIG